MTTRKRFPTLGAEIILFVRGRKFALVTLLIAVAWVPFLTTRHSLADISYSDLVYAHLELHQVNSTIDHDHNHEQTHYHDSHLTVAKVFVAIVVLLFVVFVLLKRRAPDAVLGMKFGPSVFLHYILSRHKTIVLLH